MALAMVTVIASLPPEKAAEVRALISSSLGNPALATVRSKLEDESRGPRILHFASLHALLSPHGGKAWLVLEISSDGSATDALENFVSRLEDVLEKILSHSSDWQRSDNAATFLKRHSVSPGTGYFDTPGLNFCGTPGQLLVDTLRERELAARIGEILSGQSPGVAPLQRLSEVRKALREDPKFSWGLDPPPPPVPAPAEKRSFKLQVASLAWPFVPAFLWPLLILLAPIALVLALLGGPTALSRAPVVLLHFTVYLFLGLSAVLLAIYVRFRASEARDSVSEASIASDELEGILERENAPGSVQNHMISLTVLKAGIIREFTIRLALWVVAGMTAQNPKPGFLGDIGTIHFARWVMIPKTRMLLFLSNYGGSWQSYLEDFITKAHAGLTGVWSNTVGFPRSTNLFFDGATDGERFKRFARNSMTYTPFWYSAYPDLTTDNIRENRLIRRGLACAMTQDEAVAWLALYGSSPRPPGKLEVTQIQSLVFGGLGFKGSGELLLIELPGKVADARAWLSSILPNVAFGDGRYLEAPSVLTLGFSAGALKKVGLDEAALATFPAAFLSGMSSAGRSRLLGDTGRNAPNKWRWGAKPEDVALLVYGDTPEAVSELIGEVDDRCISFGARLLTRIPLCDPALRLTDRIEPFGFVDGISQPAIRGTYRGLRNDDPIHLVEPGELILGYPDNRGQVPPGPTMSAAFDPGQLLPVDADPVDFGTFTAEERRKIGHNGSFLVIRQLEQDFEGFNAFCKKEAQRVRACFVDLPIIGDAEFIAAKMIGRWHDGSSLVRHPYVSATKLKELRGQETPSLTARPRSRPADPAARSIDQPETRNEPDHTDWAIVPDNDFLFGEEDPQGLRCPYGAHIRRANPRDSLSPGSSQQIDITNRHRTLRVGRQYEHEGSKGLMFMCLNGDIERQFEFIQQTWMGSSKFHGLDAETDPIVTDGTLGRCGFTIPTRNGPVALNPLPQFVTVRGGGYFFLAGRQLLNYLTLPPEPDQ